MSESQERMMAVVEPEKLDEFMAIANKWDVEATVLGEVTDGEHLVITWHGEVVVDVPPRSVAHDGPVYERPLARPDYLDALQSDSASLLTRPSSGHELREQLLAVLGSPNIADKSWITDQYDRYVMGNTALAMPDDAGVVRVDEATGLGVAVSTDCNGRFTKLDPFIGSQHAVAEAYRNVAATGATPLAVSDCLNFGSPEDAGVMWQFSQAVDGIIEACRSFGTPVTGGNVSFYNQTGDVAIHPTPVVAVLGVMDDVSKRTPSAWKDAGLALYVLGETRDELNGSEWAGVVHGHLGGTPPQIHLDNEKALATVLIDGARDGLFASAHDLSSGGLAVALAEGAVRHGVGASIEFEQGNAFVSLFSESAGRALVAVAPEHVEAFEAMAGGHGVPATKIGETGGGALAVGDLFSVPVAELAETHQAPLLKVFG